MENGTPVDWVQRARALLEEEVDARRRSDALTYGQPGFEVRAALRLGCEMADARAEEIARVVDGLLRAIHDPTHATVAAYHNASAVARSSISKRTEVKMDEKTRAALDAAVAAQRKSFVEGAREEIEGAAHEKKIRADEREQAVRELDAFRERAITAKQPVLIPGLTAAREALVRCGEMRNTPGRRPGNSTPPRHSP